MTDRLLGKAPTGPEGEAAGRSAPAAQGKLVGRRYRLVSPVGRGGMGMVWHAHDVLLDRDVAVKELILPYGLDHAGKQVAHRRMLREARSAARLSHPGIVTVHDVVEEDGRPWIVMELVRAWSLEQALRQSGPLPVAQAAEIGVRVLDALRHAHAAGILHRDVKPGNVLLTSDRVVLTDFGIAAIEGDVTITQTGLLMGSPAYIPPERLSGQAVTHAADLWSFGATLYAAVEGRPPYEGPDAVAVLGAILTQEPTRPQRAGALVAVIEGLLRKNPADRMTAAQVSDLLDRVLRSHGSTPPSRTPITPAPSPMPVPGDSMPMHLPPPDPPSGPMPSRIIETPSGPVRVPYDPLAEVPGGHAAPRDMPAGGSGGYRADLLSVPGHSPTADPPGAPSGGHQRGYEALRSPSADLGRPLPSDPPGELPGTPPRGTAAPVSGAGLWPLAAGQGARAGAQAAQPVTAPSRMEGRRSSRRRTGGRGGWMRDGRPTPRLLVAGGVGAAAVLAAALLILLPGDASGTAAPGPSPTVSTPADPVSPLRAGGEVPEGFRTLSGGGVSGAVAKGWTVKTGADGSAVFSGPKNSGRSIVVAKVPVADPVTALRRASKKGLDEYIEVGVAPVRYGAWNAADWEYTYVQRDSVVPMHGLTRYVALDGETAYQITFATQDLEWERNAPLLRTFFDTFAPVG
ncbi:serine/threonine-protein kinase [Streptosporangium roseum]|uniref:serine/threonine-protein kinase n=1 Tax=Streptosporangium roseum TaxID=2001 RepID=UPI000A534EED|nr:serine/threonine-protein kinase [Streptosporangium roseum]